MLARARNLFRERNWEDFSDSLVEVIGSEGIYGPHAQTAKAREVVMRIAVRHPRKEALELFRGELSAPGTSWSPGTTGGGGGRPSVSPSIKQYAFLLDKIRIQPRVTIDGTTFEVDQEISSGPASHPNPLPRDPRYIAAQAKGAPAEDTIEVPLIKIAYGRSGDKGDISNIGIMARRPEYIPIIAAQVTESRVAEYLAHLVKGKVTRYTLPGLDAFNFVCEQALGGGGMASLRNDPLGKGMAQILLSLPVRVSRKVIQGSTKTNKGRPTRQGRHP